MIADIIPSIREECSVDGKLYRWPFFLDVIGTSWHSGIGQSWRARRGARNLGRVPRKLEEDRRFESSALGRDPTPMAGVLSCRLRTA